MKENCQDNNPLIREGTSQNDRELKALDPEKILLHDLKPEDWIEFAYNYAEQVKYYSSDNPDESTGNWQAFFEDKEEIKEVVNEYYRGDIDSFFGLFVSFLKLLAFPQKSLNELPKRHLDYYYKEVLKLREKPPQPDTVHVLFELSKNAKNNLVEKGELLDAGKDSAGHPRRYKIDSPIVVNSAKVSAFRSVSFRDGRLKYAYKPKHSEVFNEDVKEGASWSAFGNENWPEAEFNLYIASRLLYMKSGERTIKLEIHFEEKPDAEIHSNNIEAKCSGVKGWIKCENKVILADPVEKKFLFNFHVNREEDEVTNYDEEVHEQGLETILPVMKLSFKKVDDYAVLKELNIRKISLMVIVDGSRSLQLQNEQGIIDVSKPFMPFGSIPKVGSKLKIQSDELDGKTLSNFGFTWKYLNLPENFSAHYEDYKLPVFDKSPFNYLPDKRYSDLISGNTAEKLIQREKYKGQRKSKVNDSNNRVHQTKLELLQEKAILDLYHDPLKKEFEIHVGSSYWSDYRRSELFGDNDKVAINFEVNNKAIRKAEFELELKHTFYHDLYPKVYAAKAINISNENDVLPEDLPNQPYTPLLDEFGLNYTAKVELDLSLEETFSDNAGLMLFHQHPFGVARIFDKNPGLLPDYSDNYLFLGLEDIEPGNNVSLLFQLEEGSENPESTNAGILQWHILSGNHWQPLERSNFVRNTTNNFLRSGIVELQIPKKINPEHNLLDEGLIWIRITLRGPIDAVAKFIDIHSQAAEAVLENEASSNDQQDMLPEGEIGQLLYRRSSIKAVTQPYPSFGGFPAESPPAFYRRSSERLRHKDRAVSIWDFEHLVLERFPEIYKVKCLNHTSRTGNKLREFSPGNVTLVLIPRISEISRTSRLQPKLGKDVMDKVKAFLKKRISPHVNLQVVNPDYEKVSLEFCVRFKEGLDFEYHKLLVGDELKKLLAPWAFNPSLDIRFGNSFSVYEIIYFLENLEYVHYLEEFKMYHHPFQGGQVKTDLVKPGSPMVILTSGDHLVEPVKTPCTNE